MLILTIVTVSARRIDVRGRDYFLVQPSLEFGAQFGSDQRDVARDVNKGRISGRQTGQRRFEPEVIYYEVSTAIYQRELHQRSNDDRNGYNTQLGLNDKNSERNDRRDSENRFQPNNEERTSSNIGQFIPTTNYNNRNKVRDRSISNHDQRNSNAYEGSLGYEREQQSRNEQQEFGNGNVNRNDKTDRRTDTRQYNTRINFPDTIISTTQYYTRPYKSGSKTTIDNEVKYNNENRDGLIYESEGSFDQGTTMVPETVTLDNRGAFDGDRCPTGKTRVGNMCVDID